HTRLVSDWSSDVCSSDLKDKLVRLVPDCGSEQFQSCRNRPAAQRRLCSSKDAACRREHHPAEISPWCWWIVSPRNWQYGLSAKCLSQFLRDPKPNRHL